MTLPSRVWSGNLSAPLTEGTRGVKLSCDTFTGVGPWLHPPWPPSLLMGTDAATSEAERGWLSRKPWRRTPFFTMIPHRNIILLSLLLLYISCSFPPCLFSDPFTFISCFLSICHIFKVPCLAALAEGGILTLPLNAAAFISHLLVCVYTRAEWS